MIQMQSSSPSKTDAPPSILAIDRTGPEVMEYMAFQLVKVCLIFQHKFAILKQIFLLIETDAEK